MVTDGRLSDVAQQAGTDPDRRRQLGAGRRLRASRLGARPEGDRPVRPRPGLRRIDIAVGDVGRRAERASSPQGQLRRRARGAAVPRRRDASLLYPGNEPDRLLDRSPEMFIPVVQATVTYGGRHDRRAEPRRRPRQPGVSARGPAGRSADGRASPAAAWCAAGRGELDRSQPLSRARLGASVVALAGPDRARDGNRRPRAAGTIVGIAEDAVGEHLEVGADLLLREHVDDGSALVRGADEQQAARADRAREPACRRSAPCRRRSRHCWRG